MVDYWVYGYSRVCIWVVFYIRIPFRVPFIRIPYYIGYLKRDPNLENHSCRYHKQKTQSPNKI